MKTKSLHLILLLISLTFLSFSDPYAIKRINDKDFRYEFYTTSKEIKPKNNKMYYWFKGGLIHKAQAGIAGELLQDKFVKMYHNNQLAEQGYFKNGLKTGIWKTWHINGSLETIQKWRNGIKSGHFYSYNEKGELLEKGKFKNDNKHGVWINFIKKDTITYKNGIVFEKKIKISKQKNQKSKSSKSESKNKIESTKENNSFFKRIFAKKQTKEKMNG